MFTLRKTRLIMLAAAFSLSATASFAQKSIYDVVPGSGPKKTSTDRSRDKSLPDIVNGRDNDDRRESRRVYPRKRKHLPPGQAKKIYGGSAKDYAPGQVKKHHRKHGKKHGKHHHHD